MQHPQTRQTPQDPAGASAPRRDDLDHGQVETEWTVGDLEDLVRRTYPDVAFEALREVGETWADPHVVFEMLLQRLDGLRQNPTAHPEGDALYHCLQAFELARERFPYDEEMMLAGLLHDVGKGIDRPHHETAGARALAGLVTPRTLFLIEHHTQAIELLASTLPKRIATHLRDSEWFDDVMALAQIDLDARVPGRPVPTVAEALAFVRSLTTW